MSSVGGVRLLNGMAHLRHSMLYYPLQDTNVKSHGQPGRWHKSFNIPNRESFSDCVQTAIDTGVVSSRARREIVQTLRTLVLQHTRYPTSEQYNAVSIMLTEKFEKLTDSLGCGYVSAECV